MRYYEAGSRIAATPDAVWSVLTDGTSWSQWDLASMELTGGSRPERQ